jgi:propionyl-CoA carboxylase beta chain
VNFAWPSAEIAVMGAEGAVNILFREKLAASGNVTAARSELTEEYQQKFSSPYTAAALGTVDDVIEPATTRGRVIAALEALQDKQLPPPSRKHGNMPV